MKVLKDFPNYAIDEYGIVWSIKRNKPICRFKDNLGYYQVELSKCGKKYKRRVHNLMAECYLTKPFDKACINHIDGDKSNNALDNLEYTSNSINTQHAYDNNLYRNKYRLKVKTINKETGEILVFNSIRSLSETLNINRKTVSSILNGTKNSNNYKYYFEYVD